MILSGTICSAALSYPSPSNSRAGFRYAEVRVFRGKSSRDEDQRDADRQQDDGIEFEALRAGCQERLKSLLVSDKKEMLKIF